MTAKRFYVATRLEQAALQIAETMRQAGWELTYDWSTHGSVQNEGKARIREVAHAELAGVFAAHVVIVALPGGRGTHAELGMALAFGRPVVLLTDGEEDLMLDGRTCAFYHHSLVRPAAGPGDLVAACEAALATREPQGTRTTDSWPVAVLLDEVARLEDVALEQRREAREALSVKEQQRAEREAERAARRATDVERAIARLVEVQEER